MRGDTSEYNEISKEIQCYLYEYGSNTHNFLFFTAVGERCLPGRLFLFLSNTGILFLKEGLLFLCDYTFMKKLTEV